MTLVNFENLTGGFGHDRLAGDSAANVINGLSGSDTISGGLGNDTLDGGGGTNTLDYSDRSDAVFISMATSTVATVAGIAEDIYTNMTHVIGGTVNDTLIANLGNSIFKGGLGNDSLDGGAATDTADYSDKTGSVVVTLNSTTRVTVTVSGQAEDTIVNMEYVTGGSGADTLTGDSQANSLAGGAGNDLLKGGVGNDTLDGNAGTDTADYSDKTSAVSVILNGTTAATVTAGGTPEDSLVNIENLIGGSAADTLTGDSLANNLTGGAGNDTLAGGSGSDTFSYALSSQGGDSITDFSTAAGDKIAFVSANFGSISAGALSASLFLASANGAATTAAQRFLFNTTDGVLAYDADGNGSGAAITIATLNVRSLAETDITIV